MTSRSANTTYPTGDYRSPAGQNTRQYSQTSRFELPRAAAILNLVFSLFLLRLRYRALFIGRLRGDQLPCLFGTLLGESCRCYLFDGLDDSRDRLAEALDIKGCDEVRQRPLPRLLVVIGELAELFWVQPEL